MGTAPIHLDAEYEEVRSESADHGYSSGGEMTRAMPDSDETIVNELRSVADHRDTLQEWSLLYRALWKILTVLLEIRADLRAQRIIQRIREKE